MNPAPAPSAASPRAIALLTLAFWAAVVALVITSPSLLLIGLGIPAVFALYVVALVAYLWYSEARAQRRTPSARPRHRRRSRLDVSHRSRLAA
jgi:membrane protein implicated in regulation of membrane protease activity